MFEFEIVEETYFESCRPHRPEVPRILTFENFHDVNGERDVPPVLHMHTTLQIDIK